MKKTVIIGVFSISMLILSGCSRSTGSGYAHPYKNSQNFYQDKLECQQRASRYNVPAPRYQRRQRVSSYSYSGVNRQGRYSGTIRPNYGYTRNSMSDAITNGTSAGMQVGYGMRYSNMVRNCMLSKGWRLSR